VSRRVATISSSPNQSQSTTKPPRDTASSTHAPQPAASKARQGRQPLLVCFLQKTEKPTPWWDIRDRPLCERAGVRGEGGRRSRQQSCRSAPCCSRLTRRPSSPTSSAKLGRARWLRCMVLCSRSCRTVRAHQHRLVLEVTGTFRVLGSRIFSVDKKQNPRHEGWGVGEWVIPAGGLMVACCKI
jgi:hypothetical protein